MDAAYQKLGEFTFRLRVPNQEVRVALNNQFIDAYAAISDRRLSYKAELVTALTTGDVPALIAAIPWRHFTGNDLAEAEGYYASVLYAFFASLDAQIIPEDLSNQGQVDLTVKIAGYTYVMEIKLRRGSTPSGAEPGEATANPALAQIQACGYSAKYRGQPGKGLFEVGLVFGRAERNLVQADWRAVAPAEAPPQG